MIISRTVQDVRSLSSVAKASGRKVALVPTMGYLHEGHASLIRRAREEAGFVIVSIFVNPTQFGPNEDLDRYPRDFERDRETCIRSGADAIFAPSVEEMYPAGFSTFIEVEGGMTRFLCGARRPGHFRGVATIVGKLFIAAQPDVSVFGQKDAQQAAVVMKMTREMGLPVRIVVSPIVRESDGLAMSSRNSYLTPEERLAAPLLKRSLDDAAELFHKGERTTEKLTEAVLRRLAGSPLIKPDYVEIVDNETFEPAARITERPVCLAVAAYLGKTRLIDNLVLGVEK